MTVDPEQRSAGPPPDDPFERDNNEAVRLFRGPLAPLVFALLGLIGLAAFSTTSVPVLLPAISGDLGRLALAPWVVTGFLITSTVVILVAGRSFDAIGLRRAFRWSCVGFTASSAACGFAPTMELLVAARTAQGAAAGFALTIAVAGIGVAVPPRLRGRAFAANATIWGVLAVGSPLLASLMAPVLGWRGVFHVSTVLGFVIAVVGWRRLPAPESRARFHLDVLGLAILSVCTVVLTLGVASSGGSAVVAVAVSSALVVWYWFHSGRHRAPVIDRSVLARHPFGSIHLIGMLAFGAVSGLNSYLPFYVQVGLGDSTTASALAVGALSVGWTIAMIVVARVMDKVSEAAVAAAGYAIVIPAMALLTAEFTYNTGVPLVIASMVLLGVGVGSVSSSMLVMLQASADSGAMGQATAAHQFGRNIGYTLSAALVGAFVVSAVQSTVDTVTAEQILAGETAMADPTLAAAIGSGFRTVGLVMLGILVLGATIAVRLWRVVSADAVSGPQGEG